MKITMLIFASLISLLSLGQDKQFSDSLIIPSYAIFELDTSQYWSYELKVNSKTDLDTNELIKVDSLLNVCINENRGSTPGMQIGEYNFVKQIVPMINEEGEKIIWVNCLCYADVIKIKYLTKKEKRKNQKLGIQPELKIISIDSTWKNQVLMTNDGGNCYFEVKINLNTSSYFDLYVNGF